MTPASSGAFELLDHDSDIGLVLAAGSAEGVFAAAVAGLTSCVTDPAGMRAKDERRVRATGSGREELLVRWVKEWLGLFHREGFLAVRVEIEELSAAAVGGVGWGEVVAGGRHRIIREVKAVTYHQAQMIESAGAWRGRVILDV